MWNSTYALAPKNTFGIAGKLRGRYVAIVGGVHGNEICGTYAVERLVTDFLAGHRELLRGTLVLVRANMSAIAANKRCVHHNLNRLFVHEYGTDIDTDSYEYQRAQELKPLLARAEFCLDLHATSTQTPPHLVVERDHLPLFYGLGVDKALTGWSKVGGPCDGTVESWVRQHGGTAATLECGWYNDTASIDYAYRKAVQFLVHLGMLSPLPSDRLVPSNFTPDIYEIDRAHRKTDDDFRWTMTPVDSFMALNEGDVLGFEGGKPVVAGPEDKYLLMPTSNPRIVPLGAEVFFTGRKVD